MKKLVIILLLTTSVFAQGKLASDFKNLIGQTYINEKEISDLKTFQYEQGKMLGEPNEGKFNSTIDVYKKGTTAIIILSKMINPSLNEYRIIEVLKIISIPKNYELRISECSRKQGYPGETIVAVIYSGTKRKVKFIKEAFALKDIRFEKISTKGVVCVNEGIE